MFLMLCSNVLITDYSFYLFFIHFLYFIFQKRYEWVFWPDSKHADFFVVLSGTTAFETKLSYPLASCEVFLEVIQDSHKTCRKKHHGENWANGVAQNVYDDSIIVHEE